MEDEKAGKVAGPSEPGEPREAPEGGADPAPPPPSTARAGPSYRVVFALVWVVVQTTLVLTADLRVDGAFGFRMFSESSSLKLVLYREVDDPDGRRLRTHVDGGVWSARGADGKVHRLNWYDRVPIPYWVFDQEMHASYGAATQLSRLAGALDDLAGHVPASEDLETRRFVLDVTVRRNGREPVVHRLASRERSVMRDP